MAKKARKTRKRPCSICRKWFLPDHRIGSRQYACSSLECQRERHRRNCTAWRMDNPDCSVGAERLRKRVVPEEKNSKTGDPMRQVAWDVVRDATSMEHAVITEEIGKVLTSWMRDERDMQLVEIQGRIGKVLGLSPRDERDMQLVEIKGRIGKVLPLSPRDEMDPFDLSVDDQTVRMKGDSAKELSDSESPGKHGD